MRRITAVMAEATALTFEANDFESCTAILREFFRQNPTASTIRVALATRHFKPLGARIWQVMDANFEAGINVIAGYIMTQPRGCVTISARVL
jgi:hypothetical protein